MHLGISERPGLVGFTMTGEACHRAEADPDQPPDPISATLGLTELNASLEQLPLGPHRLSVGAVHLGAIKTAMLSLSGFVPARIELKLSELTLHDLRLSPACMSSNEIGQGAV